MSEYPKKIMIFGRPGSGKSSFALYLAKRLNLPLYHLDKYFYEANWVEVNYEEFVKTQEKLVELEEWIIDGNATKSLKIRYDQADLVIYFNYPRLICLYRIFKRWINPDKKIDDLPPGCKKTVRINLIKYLWYFEQRVKKQIKKLQKLYPEKKFIEINNNQELLLFKDSFVDIYPANWS